jgi:PhnB protein
MNTETASATLELLPYIFFGGRCEEALNFYKAALGGTFEITRNSESHMAADIPAAWQNKIMHAKFSAHGLSFMASDGRDAKAIDPEEGNISLALRAGDRAAAERIFAALSEGGEVKMTLHQSPWGDHFGMFNDRFGNEWMVTSP